MRSAPRSEETGAAPLSRSTPRTPRSARGRRARRPPRPPGYFSASTPSPTTKRSSAMLRAQFEKGSGLALARTRVPLLLKCVLAASAPPSSATTASVAGAFSPSVATAINAPPIGRMTRVHGVPHRVHPGNLVRDEFDDVEHQRGADDPVVVEDLVLRRQRDPPVAARQAQDRHGRVQVEPRRKRKPHRPAERGQDLHWLDVSRRASAATAAPRARDQLVAVVHASGWRSRSADRS